MCNWNWKVELGKWELGRLELGTYLLHVLY
jgi:hypothetical protein